MHDRCERRAGVGKAAPGAESETEELEFIGCRLRAVSEKLDATLAHLRVLLVGHQLDAVVERSYGRHQVMTEPGAEQAGEIDGVHGFVNEPDFNTAQVLALSRIVQAN